VLILSAYIFKNYSVSYKSAKALEIIKKEKLGKEKIVLSCHSSEGKRDSKVGTVLTKKN
jgi:hypothetical protein